MFGPWGAALGAALGGMYGAYQRTRRKELAEKVKEEEMMRNMAPYTWDSVVAQMPHYGDEEGGITVNTSDGITQVVAKPLGDGNYAYEPIKGNGGGFVGSTPQSEVNVNISGTIRLDGGNSHTDMDMSKLMNDPAFVRSLTEMIRKEMTQDKNFGRVLADNSYLRQGVSTSPWQNG